MKVKRCFLIPCFAALTIALAVAAGCTNSAFSLKAGYTAGTFTGTGQGRRGPIVVQVQTSPAGIEDITILSHRETPYPGAAAMEELLELILETGSTDLDAVSGASVSSRGFLEAVEDAVAKAIAKATAKASAP